MHPLMHPLGGAYMHPLAFSRGVHICTPLCTPHGGAYTHPKGGAYMHPIYAPPLTALCRGTFSTSVWC
eukprot:NODE_1594_length_571_cov_2.795019_g1287_i0.p1 GENE.NODE_1594_length_571_cov_2.795019_g1287_i0~~NODE_1594_length_571_cov_2.795019_g1287_i0.p1  ORF type:complete len:68 (-),score=11.72 NODE_1594_length_571_cov_2.795019_g1287_i0:48-251(-)